MNTGVYDRGQNVSAKSCEPPSQPMLYEPSPEYLFTRPYPQKQHNAYQYPGSLSFDTVNLTYLSTGKGQYYFRNKFPSHKNKIQQNSACYSDRDMRKIKSAPVGESFPIDH